MGAGLYCVGSGGVSHGICAWSRSSLRGGKIQSKFLSVPHSRCSDHLRLCLCFHPRTPHPWSRPLWFSFLKRLSAVLKTSLPTVRSASTNQDDDTDKDKDTDAERCGYGFRGHVGFTSVPHAWSLPVLSFQSCIRWLASAVVTARWFPVVIMFRRMRMVCLAFLMAGIAGTATSSCCWSPRVVALQAMRSTPARMSHMHAQFGGKHFPLFPILSETPPTGPYAPPIPARSTCKPYSDNAQTLANRASLRQSCGPHAEVTRTVRADVHDGSASLTMPKCPTAKELKRLWSNNIEQQRLHCNSGKHSCPRRPSKCSPKKIRICLRIRMKRPATPGRPSRHSGPLRHSSRSPRATQHTKRSSRYCEFIQNYPRSHHFMSCTLTWRWSFLWISLVHTLIPPSSFQSRR